MFTYIIRRILYAIPILFGVNIIVFLLFFFINTPDDMAKLHLGLKRVTPEQIDTWKREHSLHQPLFFNNGWVSLASLQGNEAFNEQKVELKEGDYEIILEAPENKKLISSRHIQLDFENVKIFEDNLKKYKINDKEDSNIDTLNSTPASLKILKGTYSIRPSLETGVHSFQFSVMPQEGVSKASVTIRFSIEKPLPTHRLLLKYKASIPFLDRFTQTIFFARSLKMLFFDYGHSDIGANINKEILKRIVPSLLISLPTFFIGLLLNIFFAMILALHRGSSIDYWGVFIAVVGMSVSVMFYIIFGQVILGKYLKLFPVSGFNFGFESVRFIVMPVLIAILSGLGGSVRFYRTIFLEEINKEYVMTARAKGLSENSVLFIHVLKNAMIPILTSVVVYLPFLFVGSLLFESFFSIPGLGAFLLDAIQSKDFSIVQAMVSLGSFLYILGLILTDISYTLIDPRVRLN